MTEPKMVCVFTISSRQQQLVVRLSVLYYSTSTCRRNSFRQDSIPVGCVLPACLLYVFPWPPLDVSTSGRCRGGSYNPSSDVQRKGRGTLPCELSHVMYLVPHPNRMTDPCESITSHNFVSERLSKVVFSVIFQTSTVQGSGKNVNKKHLCSSHNKYL